MEVPEQAFVKYASSRTDEAGGNHRSKIAGTLPSDTVKNPKLSTYLALSNRSYKTEDPQCSTQTYDLIHTITIHTEQQSASYDDREKENKEEEDHPENINVNPSIPPNLSITFITEKVLKFNSFFESLGLVPPSSNTELICTKEEDDDVIYIEIVPKDDNSCKEGPEAGEQEVEYFDIFPTRSEIAYHNFDLVRIFDLVQSFDLVWSFDLGRSFNLVWSFNLLVCASVAQGGFCLFSLKDFPFVLVIDLLYFPLDVVEDALAQVMSLKVGGKIASNCTRVDDDGVEFYPKGGDNSTQDGDYILARTLQSMNLLTTLLFSHDCKMNIRCSSLAHSCERLLLKAKAEFSEQPTMHVDGPTSELNTPKEN
ncbi:hypothetical protein Tco_1094487 [Tanacetum coccineum]|uniref:Uncharacterized protein n=1 Tax=Tanacetum coccineum TaxID=301880 RepID=A0ABQ5IGZ8_9ASTR